jgi:hypothetical protein
MRYHQQSSENEIGFTINYHLTGGKKMGVEDLTTAKHPINNDHGLLLGKNSGGCDWNDHVILKDANGISITERKIIFGCKAHDNDKEIYVKSFKVMIKNIIFTLNMSYILINKEEGNYQAIINTFNISRAINSQGRYIKLTLSNEAKRQVATLALDLSDENIAELQTKDNLIAV